MAEVESYISVYPEAPNIEDARTALSKYAYSSEIGSLEDRIKDFLNGNIKSNTVSSLNGITFVEKDQNRSTGIKLFGTSGMRVSTGIRNTKTGKVLAFDYQPTSNQMVERIESITPEEGVTIVFMNGHKYEFSEGKWRRQG